MTVNSQTFQPPRRPVPRIGLTRAEVALAIGVSGNTVDVMVKEGFLPPPRRWHSRKVWLVSEIETAMAGWPSEEDNFSGQPEASDEWRAE